VEFEHEGGEELLIFSEDEGRVGADDEDDIVAPGPVVLVEAEGLAEEAFDAIACWGGADVAGDADAEARVREIVGAAEGDERAAGGFDAVFEDGGEFGAGADAVGFGKTVGRHEKILATDGAQIHTEEGGIVCAVQNLFSIIPMRAYGMATHRNGLDRAKRSRHHWKEKIMSQFPQFPSRNIGTAKTGATLSPAGTTPATDWARLLQAAKNSTADAINRWTPQAMFGDGQVNAALATGGKIVCPLVFENDIYTAMIQAAGPEPICRGVSSGIWMRFKEWYQGYQISLPWYPSFVALPMPVAPPTPNVPSPLIAGFSNGMAGLSESSLADFIRQRIGGTGMAMNGAGQFVTDYANWFSQKMTFWMGSTMWMNVLGSGPIPSFAPPYVPVGPVVGGTFKGNPGCMSGGRFMV
jgi:hypothetical protein